MEIESVTVIPMSKESKFEDLQSTFEVAFITTSFDKWYLNVLETGEKLDAICKSFAMKQHAFMMAPTALFGSTLFMSYTQTAESLDGIILDGPLHAVYTVEIDDVTTEKTVPCKYVDLITFEMKEGLGHSKKKVYKIRYGVPNARSH